MTRHPSVTTLIRSAIRTAAGLTLVVGCTSEGAGDESTGSTTAESPAVAATVPPGRQTPFCEAMVDLNARLIDDPPDDVGAAIVDVYREILPEVPDEIAEDFAAVLTALETGQPLPTTPPPSIAESGAESTPESSSGSTDSTPTTGSTIADEGFDAEPFELTTPAERINDYVSFTCRDTGNNPGPPPTEPLDQG